MYLVAVLVGLLAVSSGSLYSADSNSLYEDMLVRDLYKRLSDLADQQYFDDPSWNMNDIALESRESGRADLRDQEYLEENSPNSNGFQYISGGAGEGKQHLKPEGTQKNTQEVKSDETLPFYCHPPNPCPKGHTAKDGCHEFIEDTAEFQQEWILKMQKKGMCSCDDEHMFKCPDPKSDKSKAGSYQLDNVFNEILKGVGSNSNPYVSKELPKREFLVAKKAPIVKRSTDEIDRVLDDMIAESKRMDNPYLKDAQIHSVAKKG